jgi:arachidonate 15-lipoxygenase
VAKNPNAGRERAAGYMEIVSRLIIPTGNALSEVELPQHKTGMIHIQDIQEKAPWIMKPYEVIDALLTPSRWRCALGTDTKGARHAVKVDSTSFTHKFLKLLGRDESADLVGGASKAQVGNLRHISDSRHRELKQRARVSVLGRLDWCIRKLFWSLVWTPAVIVRLRPKKVRVPRREKAIGLITAPESYADFKSPVLVVPDDVTCGEASLSSDILIQFVHFLQDVYPIIKPGQATAAADPARRVRKAYSFLYRLVRAGPRWHPELADAARDQNLLGALAVGGPFAKLLEHSNDGGYFIDLRHMTKYEVREGLCRLGCKINFAEAGGTLRISSVEYEGETVCPSHPAWEVTERIALCSLATHLTVWRHGMQYHVGGVAPVAIITQNMPPEHPIRRLLAPHISETPSTNYYTHVTLRRSGFDVTGFGFPLDVILEYYDDGANALNISMLDVRCDTARRGIPASLDYPWHRQALRYWALFETYVAEYVNHYYRDQAAIENDKDLAQWFDLLDKHIPNGIRGYAGVLTTNSLIRLCTLYIYTVTVEHYENTLWDYAVFLPTTVHRDETIQTVGEVQSVLNFEFVISSATNRLMKGQTHLALDTRAAEIMTRLQTGLKELQDEMESGSDNYWRVYPKELDSSVSA